MAPVFYGNFIDASNCASEPVVEIEGEDEESLWTLVMTSPDQNFVQSNVRFRVSLYVCYRRSLIKPM